MRRDVRDVVVEDGLERIKAELTLESNSSTLLLAVLSRMPWSCCAAVTSFTLQRVRSLELAPLLLVDLALVLVRVLRWR